MSFQGRDEASGVDAGRARPQAPQRQVRQSVQLLDAKKVLVAADAALYARVTCYRTRTLYLYTFMNRHVTMRTGNPTLPRDSHARYVGYIH